METFLEAVDAIGPLVREKAAESERAGNVVPEVVEALHDAALFTVLAPPELGGAGLSIPAAMEITERLARHDAATAWTYGILVAGPVLVHRFSLDVRRKVFADPRLLICGTLNPVTSRAVERPDGGYTFSGVATYLSGSAHATWVIASALVIREGQPAVTDGGVEMRTALFPLEQATSLDNWNVSGMRATGSSDWSFSDVVVDAEWAFNPFTPPDRDVSDPLTVIPLWMQLGGLLVATAVGAAHHMLERFTEIAVAKVPAGGMARLCERGTAQIAVGEAQGLVLAARAVMMDTAKSIWGTGCAGGDFPNDDMARHRAGYVTAVQLAARAIDLLHDAAGMSAVKVDDVLDRCWRDVHTITQHVILSPARYEIAGRVLLGLDPGSPVI